MEGILEIKSINDKHITDVDSKSRTIQGYFAVFSNTDRDKDIIEKGAFSKTISERSAEVRFLYNHNWEKPLDRGDKGLKISEDNYGLKFEATIPKGLSYGDDLIILYENGIVDEHSIGFQTIKSHRDSGNRVIREIKLYEGSAVTMPANPLAKLTSIKSGIKETNDMISKITKAFKLGTLTDEAYVDLEIALKMLQLQAYELGKEENTQVILEPSADTQEKNFEPLFNTINNLKFNI